MTPIRYPFGDFERLVIVSLRPEMGEHGQEVGIPLRVAALLGVDRRQLYRWRLIGVTGDQAERLADAAGFHAFEVWPELLEDRIAEQSIPCAECGTLFVPRNTRARFHADLCRTTYWDREHNRRRSEDPEWQELNRKRRRAYYADAANGEYERARERGRKAKRRQREMADA